MATRRKTDPQTGRAAVHAWLDGHTDKKTVTTAVRFTLEELADIAPGHAVEVRVPPAGAVQCIEGPQHTRGTPPNVIEMEPHTWLELATGRTTWETALASGSVHASGERAHLAHLLPLHATKRR
ncbi:sterol carrier family protein [Timonella sp. A28]|uniref:sterol carrier family protein n=1 Tax=Timonella sp. A28 TaxID=3442640 RepID=UPI003EB7A397